MERKITRSWLLHDNTIFSVSFYVAATLYRAVKKKMADFKAVLKVLAALKKLIFFPQFFHFSSAINKGAMAINLRAMEQYLFSS